MGNINIDWGSLLLNIVAAIVILVVTAIVANLVKNGLAKLLSRVSILQRTEDGGKNLASSLATIASLLVWLIGLTAILSLFQLDAMLSPLQDLLRGFFAAIPGIVGAGLVFFIGFVLAKVVRQILVTALHAARFDERVANFGGNVERVSNAPIDGVQGFEQTQAQRAPQASPAQQPRTSITEILGHVVFGLILLVVGIAALQVLGLPAISEPATEMLSMILDALPLVIGAGILLTIGVVVANFVAGLLEPVLAGLNLDEKLRDAGVNGTVNVTKILVTVVRVAIILFFAVAAANLLNFEAITDILDTVLGLAGRIIFGAVVILAGVFIANLLAKLVSGNASMIIRVATIVLFSAMGLQFMGIADSIINLAFAALVVGGAAAAALAFGLGGRDAAARQLDKLQNKTDAKDTVKD